MAIYSEFSPLKMVIFHSYVSLPEGIILKTISYSNVAMENPRTKWRLQWENQQIEDFPWRHLITGW